MCIYWCLCKLCIHIHTCIYIYIYVHIHTHAQEIEQGHIHTYIYMYVYVLIESCIQHWKTTCLLLIRISLACARASKLTTTNTYIHTYIHTYMIVVVNFDAHSTSQPVDFLTWPLRYTCLLLLISMLWHRQAILESREDKLSSSAECRIRTQGLRHLLASRLNACWQTDWAIEDQIKNLNSTARPYDQQAFSPFDLTASWLSHMAFVIYMFVVVNFDALAQANDIRIDMRQIVFLCWMQDSNPRSQTLIRQQTECLLINRLSNRGSS